MPVPPPEPILVAAVSARMLAELATAAGHRVVAVDRFGDLDLCRTCPTVVAAEGGLAALVDAARGLDAPSVVYGAGFEPPAAGRPAGRGPRAARQSSRDAGAGPRPRRAGHGPAGRGPPLPAHLPRRRGRGARRALARLAAQAPAGRGGARRARVARRAARRRRGRAGARRRPRMLGGRGRRRARRGPARRQRAARRRARVRRPRLPVVRQRRAAATGRGRARRAGRRPATSASAWRRRSACAGCSAWTSCGTARVRGRSRSTRGRAARSRRSRPRTA